MRLHDQSKVLQFLLQHGDGAARHLHPPDGIRCLLRGNAIAPTHQEYLQELGGFAGIGQATSQQIVP